MKNQIVIVPFPFDGFSDLKIRPVLCLSEAVGKYDHIIVAFISTQISDAHELSDLIIFSTDADFLASILVRSATPFLSVK